MKDLISTRKIVAVHLYNDYSGSPRILAQWLQHAVQEGTEVQLHTSGPGGILDEVDGVELRPFTYAPHPRLLLRLFRFLHIQVLLFFRFARLEKDVVVYVNTILPVGAILGAKWARIPVVCQVHEVAVRPWPLDRLLKWVVRRFSDQLIFVSEYVANSCGIQHAESRVVPNALSPAFISKMHAKTPLCGPQFRALMLASPRAYKGLDQFRLLAQVLPAVQFELVLNGSQEGVDRYFLGQSMPDNLQVWPLQKDVHPFYARANVVLNLSLPDGWVETFGMTALEGMAYGLPAIVPPVGGIAELVTDRESGFHCDPYEISALADRIKRLSESPQLYREMSAAARYQAGKYDFDRFAKAIDECVADARGSGRPKSGRQTHPGTLSTS